MVLLYLPKWVAGNYAQAQAVVLRAGMQSAGQCLVHDKGLTAKQKAAVLRRRSPSTGIMTILSASECLHEAN